MLRRETFTMTSSFADIANRTVQDCRVGISYFRTLSQLPSAQVRF
jgi:hypothetical protein